MHLLTLVSAFMLHPFFFTTSFILTYIFTAHYYSVEVFGALGSVVLIWLLTGVLVYEAILRIITPEPVDGKIMFITACECRD